MQTIAIPSSSAAYFERLDPVRAVAILWVFAFHFCGACWGWKTHEWLQGWEQTPSYLAWPGQAFAAVARFGGLGVPLFFVLSGFLIHYTYCRGSSPSVGNFFLRRFGRIYPPYFVALVAVTILGGFLMRERGRTSFLHHLLLIHNYRQDTLYHINGSFWSLALEAQYYLLYPLLLSARRAVGMPTILWTSFTVKIALSALPSLGLIQLGRDAQACLLLPEKYFEWILGMYVADCLLQGRRAFPVHYSAAWLCFGALFFLERPWVELAIGPVASLGTAIWIDRVVRAPSRGTRIERLLIPVGVVSYSLYLWHQPIINFLAKRIYKAPSFQELLPTPGLFLATLGLALVGTAVAAILAYRFTEVPSMEVTKRLARRLTDASPKENQKREKRLAA
jgi:peptidoglycan/LPS O-acetylase OafA/YrhL